MEVNGVEEVGSLFGKVFLSIVLSISGIGTATSGSSAGVQPAMNPRSRIGFFAGSGSKFLFDAGHVGLWSMTCLTVKTVL